MGSISKVDEASFDSEVLKSDLPVLVDFWAEWCGPCKSLAPILEEVTKEFSGRVKICKLNVDDNNAVAAKYNVRGIPTLVMFKSGAPVATKVGLLSKTQLSEFLEQSCSE